jgi:bacillithiol biosynthesis cysteine-adding enzyme BshC
VRTEFQRKIMDISHSRHFSKLARDYITAFDTSAINTFFPLSPNVQGSEFLELLNDRAAKGSTNEEKSKRKVLIDTLRKQHSNAGTLTQKVEENLKFLESEKCCAIVTGQQVGILGGPLYTVYKALHTVILSNWYRKRYPEFQFVPVFWQETEDHDFEETSGINIITSNFELRNIKYQPKNDISRRQIGSLQFEKEALESVFAEIESFIPKTDFTDETLALYRSAYQEDFTFAEAQAQLLGELLSKEGLLILDANTPELKRQVTYLFKKEIETAPYLSDNIKEIGKKLNAEGYHAQLEPDGINLFLAENGRRYKLTKTGDAFSYNNSIINISDPGKIITEHPERFSMNVVMRPLIQDAILPTVAYVAGPGEIAYFAQLKIAYDWSGITMPLIVPRIGMTIVEDRFDKLLQKHNIITEDFLEKGEDMIKGVLQSEQEIILSNSFAKTNNELDISLEQLRNVVASTDATLDQALTSLKGKILTQLKDFENKSLAAERKKQSGTKQQFEKAMNVLLPNEKLQERELNLLYFLNKYGINFWKNLKTRLFEESVEIHEHRIIKATEVIESLPVT